MESAGRKDLASGCLLLARHVITNVYTVDRDVGGLYTLEMDF
jgi:hypothetical protein